MGWSSELVLHSVAFLPALVLPVAAPAEIDQGGPVQLNDNVFSGAGVVDYAITSDSASVVYRSDEQSGALELFAVPIDKSTPAARLNPPLGQNGDVAGFELTPAGDVVVCRSRFSSSTAVEELFALHRRGRRARAPQPRGRGRDRTPTLQSVPIAGGSALTIHADVLDFQLSPDGAEVAFRAGSANAPALFVGSSFGGPTADVTPPQGHVGGLPRYAIDAAGGRVVFLCTRFTLRFELWGAPLDGSGPPERLGPPTIGDQGVAGFLVTGGEVLFRDDLAFRSHDQLYRVTPAGAAVHELVNDPLPAGDEAVGDVTSFLLDPRGERVFYGVQQGSAGPSGTISVRSAGGFGVPLFMAEAPSPALAPVAVLPDGRAVILAGQPAFGEPGYNLVPAAGGPALQLTHEVGLAPLLTPDGAHLLYVEDARVHTVPTDASQAPVVIDSALIVGAGVEVSATQNESVRLTPDGARVVFLAERLTVSGIRQPGLFSAPTDGSGPAIPLHPALPHGGVDHFDLASTGEVLFVSQADNFAPRLLQRVPADGSLPPALVAGGPELSVTGGLVTARETFQITPDGRRVVFLGGSANTAVQLYAAPVDGSHPPVRLNARLPSGGDVLQFEPFTSPISGFQIGSRFLVTPDGARVVYVADQRVDQRFELFSVELPTFAHAQPARPHRPVRLNGPLAGSQVFHVAITPDAQTVVYDALQDSAFVYDLYRTPIAGGPSVKVNAPGSGNTSLFWELAPDGTGLLYRADPNVPGHFELFHAVLDGSRPPVLASGDLPLDTDVSLVIRFGTDGRRAFFLTQQQRLLGVDSIFELFTTTSTLLRPAAEPAF